MVALVSYVALRKTQALLRTTAPALAALGLLVMATGCAGGGTTGHVAIGGVGPSPSAPHDVPPDGDVVLVPLDGPAPGAAKPSRTPSGTDTGTGPRTPSSGAPRTPSSPHGTPTTPGGPASGSTAQAGGGTDSGTGPGSATGGGTGSGGTGSGGTGPGGTGSGGTGSGGTGSGGTGSGGGSGGATTAPPTAARLTVSAPTRTADADRWCEKVAVTFTNAGGLPVTAGTVTFGTHIIGGLGIDWATVETAKPVPVPLAGGASRTASWDLCVDAWRVPLGMHIETRDVTLS
ncbi:hypothetical protein ACIQCJ_01250 [Streptomyces sp. NPDC093221]|uniref:hypothetical protein n=1 Tax=Streptomyces sp. NPDC093221 TaxID=3366032 RepID=UPI003801231C